MIQINKHPAHIEITAKQNKTKKEIDRKTKESYRKVQAMYQTAKYFYNLKNQPEDIRMPSHSTLKKIR